MLSLQFEFLERCERGLVKYAKGKRRFLKSFLLFAESSHREVRGSSELLPIQSSFTPLPLETLECLYRITRILVLTIFRFFKYFSVCKYRQIFPHGIIKDYSMYLYSTCYMTQKHYAMAIYN